MADELPGLKPNKGIPKWMIPGIISAQLADADTTRRVLGQGGHESNPMMQSIASNPALLYGMKGGIGALSAYGANKISKMGHPKIGKAIGIAGMVAPGLAAIHNARQIR